MIQLNSDNLDKNFIAPEFKLLNVDDKYYSLNNYKNKPNFKGIVIAFICNHCPYVKPKTKQIRQDSIDLLNIGIYFIAIMSNDVKKYPEDSFENMKEFHKKNNFSFPYLIDTTQEVAKKYNAVCTPDFFGFNKDLKLSYRGRINSSLTEEKSDLERDLFNAMCLIAKTGQGPDQQHNSIGCSIKWADSNTASA